MSWFLRPRVYSNGCLASMTPMCLKMSSNHKNVMHALTISHDFLTILDRYIVPFRALTVPFWSF